MTAKLRAEIYRLKQELQKLEIDAGVEDSKAGRVWTTRQVEQILRLERHKKKALEIARTYKRILGNIQNLLHWLE